VTGIDATSTLYELGARTIAVVLDRALTRAWRLDFATAQAQEPGTHQRVVFFLKLGSQLLHQGIIHGTRIEIARCGATIFKTGKHGHATHRATSHAQPAHASAKRSREAQQGVAVIVEQVAKGCHYRLGTIVALEKILATLLGTSLYIKRGKFLHLSNIEQ
jgi:hypothetical protein